MEKSTETLVIKIGGHDIADPEFLSQLAQIVAELAAPPVIIHGGGAEITELQQALGIQPQYVDGLRVTDAASLKVVEMVLSGLVNKRVTRHLINAGVDALGLSGIDRGLLHARPIPLMGFTGQITRVNARILHELRAARIAPVIAPLCLAEDGSSAYNVNADHVAGAVAAAIGAQRVIFVTNVPGVLVSGELVWQMERAQAERLIADGTIYGGMIPKVRSALDALHSGVPQAMITNLDGLQLNSGTLFI